MEVNIIPREDLTMVRRRGVTNDVGEGRAVDCNDILSCYSLTWAERGVRIIRPGEVVGAGLASTGLTPVSVVTIISASPHLPADLTLTVGMERHGTVSPSH